MPLACNKASSAPWIIGPRCEEHLALII